MTEAIVNTNQNQPLTVVIGCDTFPPDINGASRFAERLAGGLARHGNNVHVIAAAFDEQTYLAGRNYAGALLMTANEVNTEHLLNYRKIIVTADALETLSRRTAL